MLLDVLITVTTFTLKAKVRITSLWLQDAQLSGSRLPVLPDEMMKIEGGQPIVVCFKERKPESVVLPVYVMTDRTMHRKPRPFDLSGSAQMTPPSTTPDIPVSSPSARGVSSKKSVTVPTSQEAVAEGSSRKQQDTAKEKRASPKEDEEGKCMVKREAKRGL
ncbi:unnamed protein product [Gongylonema pulchrum]|uniref:Uncharacterized protein n=1 Tax=Gongylonema pulchrum TaxID=637853 RepID=A0A3P6RG33_9BILA|nr:unnamed protein product [Gongylonema pulchrum]